MTDTSSNWKERRRANRLTLETEGQLSIRLQIPGRSLVEAPLRTVSSRNCSFLVDSVDADALRAGLSLMAELSVEGTPVPVHVDVARRVAEREVAVRFRPPFSKELQSLERFLQPRYLGLSLREIDPGQLQPSGNRRLRWFQGTNDTNLFSWSDGETGTVVQQQLIFLDNVVEWHAGGDPRTGKVKQEVRGYGGWVGSDVLEFEPAPSGRTIQDARVLISSARIDEAVKKGFLAKLGHPEI